MANDVNQEVLVKLPTGTVWPLFKREQRVMNEKIKRYTDDFAFTNVSDLSDLDRVVTLELLHWRWTSWLSRQVDYWDEPIDEKQIASQIKDTETQLKALKTQLGIDKVRRDKETGEGSVADYIDKLLTRARWFGIKRNEEAAMAITLWKELQGKITRYDNSLPEERTEFKSDWTDIFEWLREEAFPKFDEIDRKFRQDGENAQRLWIREQ